MTVTLIASSPTKEGLLELAKKYWVGSAIEFTEFGGVRNAKGPIRNVHIREVKGRWRLERI